VKFNVELVVFVAICPGWRRGVQGKSAAWTANWSRWTTS